MVGSDVADIDSGLATPLEIWQALAAEGYEVTYRRIPLSRERTPEAADLDVLHHQLLQQPEGMHHRTALVTLAASKLYVIIADTGHIFHTSGS